MVRDAAAVLGLLLLAVGFGLAWLPLGFIVPGGLLLSGAVLGYLSRGDGKE